MSFLPSFILSPPEDVDNEADHEYGVYDEPESEKVRPIGRSNHLWYEVLIVTEIPNWRTSVQFGVTKTGQALKQKKILLSSYFHSSSYLIIIVSRTGVTGVVTI